MLNKLYNNIQAEALLFLQNKELWKCVSDSIIWLKSWLSAWVQAKATVVGAVKTRPRRESTLTHNVWREMYSSRGQHRRRDRWEGERLMKRVFDAARRAAAGSVVVKNWSSSITIKLQSGQNTDEDRGHASPSSFAALLPLVSPPSILYSLLSTPLCLLIFPLSFHTILSTSILLFSCVTFSIPCLSLCLVSPLLSCSIPSPFFLPSLGGTTVSD